MKGTATWQHGGKSQYALSLARNVNSYILLLNHPLFTAASCRAPSQTWV